MTSLIQRTWKPTIVFVVLAVAIGWPVHNRWWGACAGITALILTPLIWPRIVNGGLGTVAGSGARAGALITAIAHMVPGVVAVIWFRIAYAIAPGGGGDWAGWEHVAALFLSVPLAGVAGLVGAALGAMLVRRGGEAEPTSAGAAEKSATGP